ncbi:TPA: hypothetical protein ACWLUJ_005731 [Pseudomonas aeruginosa]
MPSKPIPHARFDLDTIRAFLTEADGDESQRSAAIDVLGMLEAQRKMVFNKADVTRLRRMVSALDKQEQHLLQVVGPEIAPRSIRASNLADSQALRRILDVIDRANC